MLAVCDGGSTKADWKFVSDKGEISDYTTTGFNPNYNTGEQITSFVKHELGNKLNTAAVQAVYYYGAGCWDPGRRKIVADALVKVFTGAKIEVSHDMLAAARATCGNEPGISCILGTGSNSVLYDGTKEIDHVTNLGFLLGDEGSGAQIGKKLVQAYFYREMPEELHPVIEQICPNGRKEILDKVYHSNIVPAAYLASFVRVFAGHFEHPFVKQVFKDCFHEFLTRHVCKYENHHTLPVHFVGSIAWHCKNILQESMDELNLQTGRILHKPILNLLNYHLNNEKGFQSNPAE